MLGRPAVYSVYRQHGSRHHVLFARGWPRSAPSTAGPDSVTSVTASDIALDFHAFLNTILSSSLVVWSLRFCGQSVRCDVSRGAWIGGHRHRSRCRRYPTSDIDICYSDVGDKYVGLKNIIPISEVFRYRHQSSFRYPTLKKKNISPCRFKPAVPGMVSNHYNSKLLKLSDKVGMSDIG